LHLTGQADRSYCYVSDGSGDWDKIPGPPFEFFAGADNLYVQVFEVTPRDVSAQAQCWGWQDGALTYLGQADTRANAGKSLELRGDGFLLSGEPNWPEGRVPEVGQSGLQVPPPYAVRTTEDPTECFSHKGTLELCKQAIGNPAAASFVLVWEWVPHFALGGNSAWLNAIDGYRVYAIDPATGIRHSMKTVTPAAMKMVLLPLPSGKSCYGVEAYAEGIKYGGLIVSPMVTHCPGTEPATKKIVVKPVSWLSSGQFWETESCSFKDHLHGVVWDLNTPGEVMVGSLLDVGKDPICLKEAAVTAAVKFPLPTLPGGAVIQSARLRFSSTYKEYGATGLGTSLKLACIGDWGIATKDWTGLVPAQHYVDVYSEPHSLITTTYNHQLDSLSGWDDSPDLDVKWQVIDWFEDPGSNHGFILAPRAAPIPKVYPGSATCFTRFANFELEISYFTP
jgi:hypothetical protein